MTRAWPVGHDARVETVIVSCPACAGVYRLEARRLGARGARVRCPACAQRFVVDATGGPSFPGVVPSANGDEAQTLAQAMAFLERRCGDELGRADADRQLFSRCGEPLLEAWARYRRAAPTGSASRFRSALHERFGVTLPGAAPADDHPV